MVEEVIRDNRVRAVALTGSEKAGGIVASQAGSEIKKCVLELGGSDPFIILADADLDNAIPMADIGRLQNCGQSCIAAKRFIVVKKLAQEFTSLLAKRFEQKFMGDPLKEQTEIGPLANEDILRDIERQVKESVKLGAKIITGGKRWGDKGYYYEPTILSDVRPGMPAYHEELFGPVASIIVARDTDDAIRIANDTDFGLGASIWTENSELAKQLAQSINAGSVFINGIVKSDPRLPFGGINRSGYGRELSELGIKEFANAKTVWIK